MLNVTYVFVNRFSLQRTKKKKLSKLDIIQLLYDIIQLLYDIQFCQNPLAEFSGRACEAENEKILADVRRPIFLLEDFDKTVCIQ